MEVDIVLAEHNIQIGSWSGIVHPPLSATCYSELNRCYESNVSDDIRP